MAAITIDIIPLIRELKNVNLRSFLKNAGNDSKLINQIAKVENEWKLLIQDLDKLSGKITKSGLSSSLKGDAMSIVYHCESLTKIMGPLLIEGGSFVPGPIGIVCSLGLAIADFATGNVFGGIINLLGCIPFAKAGIKTIKPLINNIIRDLCNNPIVITAIKSAHRAPSSNRITRIVRSDAERIFSNISPKGDTFIAKESTHIIQPPLFKDIEEKVAGMTFNVGNYSNLPPSTRKMIYTLGTNTGRSNIFRFP